MITFQARQRTIAALHALRSGDGYPDQPGGTPQVGTTLSVQKSLAFLGSRPADPDSLHSFVMAAIDPATGTCTPPGAQTPSVLLTAGALLSLHALDAAQSLARFLQPGLDWMAENARSREEHFMTIAVADECAVPVPLPDSVAFFRALEQPDGTFGSSVLTNGIASSALLRLGEPLRNPDAVAALMLAAQTREGGFADTDGAADLWTTYCVMRALDLMQVSPNVATLAPWVRAMQTPEGGFGQGSTSANATYQCLSILDWVVAPVLDAARSGDVGGVSRHLRAGGDPDLCDLQGWSLLAAAAVRGRADVVRILLSADVSGGRSADPGLRMPEADALPIFWAGQSGDIETVAALLRARPEQLFATSSVNGHTVLLQAAFFGTQRHRDLIAWLLEHVSDILDLHGEEQVEATRNRLLAACNVRGYTARTMAQLWNNQAIAAVVDPLDHSTEQDRDDYYRRLLAAIAEPPPSDPVERDAQQRTEQLLATIGDGFAAMTAVATDDSAVALREAALLEAVSAQLEDERLDINRRGGPLSETPVIVAVTGTDASPRIGEARRRLLTLLLEHGADPDLPERHPMAVDAVIRAAVLNHFDCLKEIARFRPPLAFAAALNERPAINGQTALDDTVHRALTASDDTVQSHLDQIVWAVGHGARTDIPDFTGVTVADRARLAADDAVLRQRAPVVLAALGVKRPAQAQTAEAQTTPRLPGGTSAPAPAVAGSPTPATT